MEGVWGDGVFFDWLGVVGLVGFMCMDCIMGDCKWEG